MNSSSVIWLAAVVVLIDTGYEASAISVVPYGSVLRLTDGIVELT